MKKKPAASTQVRIDMGLSNEIDILRAGFGVRTSRAAFVESLIRKGIQVEKEIRDNRILNAASK